MIGHLPPQVVIGLVVLAVIVVRHTRPRRATAARLFIAPSIVLGVGVLAMLPAVGALTRLTATDAAFLVADIVVTLGASVVRAASVRLEAPGSDAQGEGHVRYRYGTATLLLWAASVLLKFAFAALGHAWGVSDALVGGSVLAFLGLSVLAQNTVLLVRCRRLTGWAHGRDLGRRLRANGVGGVRRSAR
jgi:hypothetical protein